MSGVGLVDLGEEPGGFEQEVHSLEGLGLFVFVLDGDSGCGCLGLGLWFDLQLHNMNIIFQ